MIIYKKKIFIIIIHYTIIEIRSIQIRVNANIREDKQNVDCNAILKVSLFSEA